MGTKTETVADFSVVFSSKGYLKAVESGETGNECACCGKQTTRQFFVEFLDQGCYPVGPECFKKLKKAGIKVFTAEELG